MVGKLYTFMTPYYNSQKHKYGCKARPVLVIGKADKSDYIVIPLSRVTKSENLDLRYDIRVEANMYPLLKLTADSYLRTHKQTVLNEKLLGDEISNMSEIYPELYKQTLKQVYKFQKEMLINAI